MLNSDIERGKILINTEIRKGLGTRLSHGSDPWSQQCTRLTSCPYWVPIQHLSNLQIRFQNSPELGSLLISQFQDIAFIKRFSVKLRLKSISQIRSSVCRYSRNQMGLARN